MVSYAMLGDPARLVRASTTQVDSRLGDSPVRLHGNTEPYTHFNKYRFIVVRAPWFRQFHPLPPRAAKIFHSEPDGYLSRHLISHGTVDTLNYEDLGFVVSGRVGHDHVLAVPVIADIRPRVLRSREEGSPTAGPTRKRTKKGKSGRRRAGPGRDVATQHCLHSFGNQGLGCRLLPAASAFVHGPRTFDFHALSTTRCIYMTMGRTPPHLHRPLSQLRYGATLSNAVWQHIFDNWCPHGP
ncbi:hypothetical protein J6590_036706 [Homalodisca vitripennis]|nr:hypothetical protein J6590_036706 [Homalodisca vitripennis]